MESLRGPLKKLSTALVEDREPARRYPEIFAGGFRGNALTYPDPGEPVVTTDTLVHEWPNEEDLANIAEKAAGVARGLGLEPRVAFVSFSTLRPTTLRALMSANSASRSSTYSVM